jgi:hypothetical protein
MPDVLAEYWALFVFLAIGAFALWYFLRGDPYRPLMTFEEGALEEMSQVRAQLEAEGIRCKVRTDIARDAMRLTPSQVQRVPSTMSLVVHRKDYERAQAMLGRSGGR